MGYSDLEALAHGSESLLALIRNSEIKFDRDAANVLLKAADALQTALRHIESHGEPAQIDYAPLLEELHDVATQDNITQACEPVQIAREQRDPIPASTDQPASGSDSDSAGDSLAASDSAAPFVAESSIRVDLTVVDTLMNLVGELVLARNSIVQFASAEQSGAIISAAQRLNLITSELQEEVMRTRLQPIRHIWKRFPRIIRDIADTSSKRLRLEMHGAETELDRSIIEAISDPLLHLLRNAADHGIESPEQRRAKGKPEEGLIHLRAFHEGGQVNIEVADDGAGIPVEKLKQRALQSGLLNKSRIDEMSDEEARQLVFLPGLSSAATVTNLSGRGVGMDAVKSRIEKFGGVIDVQDRGGHGTVCKIRIPLTLAIIPALIIEMAEQQYAIPQANLVEFVRLDENHTDRVEQVHGVPVYRLRGQLLPLINLDQALEVRPASSAAQLAEKNNGTVNIVIVRADNHQFGLLVDDIHDTQEIVVKPLGSELKGINEFAGATILGDGCVALILDVLVLGQAAGLVGEADLESHLAIDGTHANKAAAADHNDVESETLLLFEIGGSRSAMALEKVARLEEFPPGAIERAGNREMVQYRGDILPLIGVSAALGNVSSSHGSSAEIDAESTIPVVVYTDHGRSVGLKVDRIIDIVEERVVIPADSSSSTLLYPVVVQGAITEMLNVDDFVRHADHEFSHHT